MRPCPERVLEHAARLYGGRMWNEKGRTRMWLELLTSHALRVWDEKYGPLNDEQLAYAEELFIWALNDGEKGGNRERYRFVQNALKKLVNHERVHEGMQRRATITVAVDVALVDKLGLDKAMVAA